MLDDLNELKTFRAILAAGSLSVAGRDLGLSLAVVSKRLASLERRAGTRLIHRTTRSLAATEEGERLLVDIERALDAIAVGEERLASGREEVVGTLRVSAPASFGRRHVAPILGELAGRHPRLAVSLVLEDRLADIVAEGIDVAIRIGAPVDSSMMMRKLADNRRILVACPSYLEGSGRPRTPEEADRLAFVRYDRSDTPWRLHGPRSATATIAARARLRVDSGEVVHDWVLAGRGIMLKSEVDVVDDLATGRLERVLPEWDGGSVPVYALYPTSRHLPPKIRLFLDAMTGRRQPSVGG